MGWATFWAFFSQTHRVALSLCPATHPQSFSKTIFKRGLKEFYISDEDGSEPGQVCALDFSSKFCNVCQLPVCNPLSPSKQNDYILLVAEVTNVKKLQRDK
jgi:hypothetical protein